MDDIAGLSAELRLYAKTEMPFPPDDICSKAATAIDALQARVKELEDHNRRLGQGGAERYWENRYRDEVAATARAEQERDEAYERAAKVAEQPMLPCDIGGDLILDRYTAATIAAAVRRLAGPEKEGK